MLLCLRLLLACSLLAGIACRPDSRFSCGEAEGEAHRLYDAGELLPARDLLLKSLKSAQGACLWRQKTLLADVYVLLRQNQDALWLLNEAPLPPDADADTRYRFHLAKGYAAADPTALVEAGRIAAQAANPRWEVDALIRLANIENRRNHAAAAESSYGKAVQVAERHANDRAIAEAYAAQGFFLFRQERLGQAELALGRALALAEKVGLPLVAMRCQGNLGLIYMRWGDYARALQLITLAEQTASRRGLRADQVRLLQNLGNIQSMLGQSPVARNYLEQSLQLARAAKDRGSEATILYNLSLTYIEAGNLDQAENAASISYQLRRELKDPDAETLHRFSEARIRRARGDLPAAASILRALLPTNDMLPWLSWSVHAELASVSERLNDDATAAAHYEQAIAIMHRARREIYSAASQLSFTSGNIGLHQQYIRFLAERAKPEAALRIADWSRVLGSSPNPVPRFTLEQLRRECRLRKESLIVFSLGARESYGWVVTPSRTQMVPLPGEATIREAVDRWEREMDSPQRETAAGSALYNLVFRPLLRPEERIGTVWMVPDGVLQRINPEALWVDGRYWIEEGAVARVASISAFLPALPVAPEAKFAAKKVFALGDPESPAREFPNLPGTALEIDQIAKNFEVFTLRGKAATPRAYLDGEPEHYGYLHFATHSVANVYDPMESALILSRGSTGYQLTAKEIATHPIRARLVTLASCKSAGERVSAGGLLGLGFAFLQAGAQMVITSLWNVEDTAALRFSASLYRGIAKGKVVTNAMREAKIELLREGGPNGSVRRWSAWVLIAGATRERS